MALQMRTKCEKCETPVAPHDVVFICTYECTWCANCARTMSYICPNCGGELVPRPRPARAAESVST